MAVTIEAAGIRDALSAKPTEDMLIVRLLTVATAMIDKYSPDAPADVANEAAILYVAYLRESVNPATPDSTGPTRATAFRHSGAQALISPWKIRRAGAC